MSLSWRNRLQVHLGHDRVALGRLGRGFGSALKACHLEPCQGAGESGGWPAAVAALDAALRACGSRGAEATVILSNAFLRYQLVPWNGEIRGGSERDAFIRLGFQRVFGDAAQGWDIRVSDERYGAPAIATAIDRNQLAAVNGCGRSHGIVVTSVQPYLMWAFNRWRRELAADDFCFVLVEKRHACLALRAGGSWRAVRVVPLNGREPQAAVGELVERELCLAGLDPARVRLFLRAPDHGHFEPRGSDLPRSVLLGESGRLPGPHAGDAMSALTGRS